MSFSGFRLEDADDKSTGAAVIFTEVTDQHLARDHMAVLNPLAERIGRSLDVRKAAQELTHVLVLLGFADPAGVIVASR